MSATIKRFLTKDIPLTALADEKLSRVSELKDVIAVAALPDIHAKPDNPYPTGTVVVTKNTIYPTLIGQDIGCAMGIWHSTLKADALTPALIKDIFTRLAETVTDNKPKKDHVSDAELRAIVAKGARWAREKGLISETERSRMEHGGQFLADSEQHEAARAFPRDAWKGGMRKAKSLGGGNHFLELHRITKILDPVIAKTIGLSEGDVLVWVHTGSSSLGKRLENFYTQRWNTGDQRRSIRQKWRRLLYHFEWDQITRVAHRMKLVGGMAMDEGLDAESPEAKRYMRAHRAAMNYALVNRIFLVNMLKDAVRKSFPNANFSCLIDVAHESIQQERFKDGPVWVHRNGASRAMPPFLWQDPWGQGLGQLLPLPGSLGSQSYLAVSLPGVEESFRSVNHGAGRVLEKPDARAAISPEAVSQFESQKGRKIFYAGRGDDIVEQMPAAFKDISAVAKALEVHQLARLIVQTEPIASLKS